MSNVYKAILTIILITVVSENALTNEYTNWSVLTKADLNINTHNSEGINIPNFCPSCIGIKTGTGLGFGLAAGFLYNNQNTLLGMKNSFGVLMSYNTRNALLENQAFLGNVIEGNTVTKGLVNYSMDTKISTLEFEPLFYFYPISDIPVSLKLGLSIALPITKQFTYKEEVGSDGLLLPNGKTSNTYPESEIPNTAALFIGVPIGIKYDLYTMSNFKISPEINYNYALSNFQSDSKWTMSKFSAGIAIEYRFNKATIPTPIEPPMPSIPILEEEKTNIECIAKWRINNTEYSNKSEVQLNSFKTEYYRTAPILPFIFFEHNSAELPNQNSLRSPIKGEKINDDFQLMQNSFLTDISTILNKGKNVKVTAFYLETENENIGKARLDNTVSFLNNQGISKDLIIGTVKAINNKTLKYPELAEEYQSVVLHYDDINDSNERILTDSKVNYSDLDLELVLNPESTAGIQSVNGEVLINNKYHSKIDSLNIIIHISKDELPTIIKDQRIVLQANYTINDNSGNSKKYTEELRININETNLPEILNYVKNSTNNYNEYILAINSFDQQSPFIISEIAKTKMYDAINMGKKVQVIGLTDNLGNIDYNSKLADRRVKSILRLLSIDNSQIEITTLDSYPFDNNTTIGRMLNRSVIIRIYEN